MAQEIAKENKEIEVRFLEVDKDDLIKKALALGADDKGEVMLNEIIFYNLKEEWSKNDKLVKIRDNGKKILLSYKHHKEETIDGTEEVEFEVSDKQNAILFLERLGLTASRYQQKLRHTLLLDGVTIDIDTWPKIPTYVEFEGESEEALRAVSAKLGFDWVNVLFEKPGKVIGERYKIPIHTLKYFMFDRCE